jgi:hypothetical protein
MGWQCWMRPWVWNHSTEKKRTTIVCCFSLWHWTSPYTEHNGELGLHNGSFFLLCATWPVLNHFPVQQGSVKTVIHFCFQQERIKVNTPNRMILLANTSRLTFHFKWRRQRLGLTLWAHITLSAPGAPSIGRSFGINLTLTTKNSLTFFSLCGSTAETSWKYRVD